MLVVVILVDKKRKLELFCFYYVKRSRLENIILIIFCYHIIDGYGIRFTPEYRKVSGWWKKTF